MATLEYNGFTNLDNVKIDEWHSIPVYEVDGLSHGTTEHRVSGTALISNTTAATFEDRLLSARTLLTRPRGALVIDLDGQSHINLAAGGDDADGPFGDFRISDPVTPLCSVVSFDVQFFQYEITGAETRGDVIAHRWTQEWEIGADGLMRHTVAGSLRVIASALATAAASINIGSNPDAYRELIVAPLPPGFRRERMLFATDDTGNRLLYTVEDKEYGRDLPAPATTGTGSFRWERTMGSKLGMLGVKVFECELTAPPSVSTRDLLAAAVEVSKQKITYAGLKPDIIHSIRVSEPDLFNENKIGYRVMATGASVIEGQRGGQISPPNFDLYQDLISDAGLAGYADLPIYAHNAIRSLRRTLYAPVDCDGNTALLHLAGVPKSGWEQNNAYDIDLLAVTAPAAVFDGTDPSVSDGQDIAAEGHVTAPYMYFDAKDRIEVKDTGMVLLRSNVINTPDAPVQLHKPEVYMFTEIAMSRLGSAPGRPMRPLPVGSVVKSESFRVSTGELDANNKRLFTAAFTRVVQLAQAPGAASFLLPLGGSDGHVRFWPSGSDGKMEMPIDARVLNNTASRDIFQQDGQHPFPVGPAQEYVT